MSVLWKNYYLRNTTHYINTLPLQFCPYFVDSEEGQMKATILFVTLVTIGCTTYPLTVLPIFYDNNGREITYVETSKEKNLSAIKNGKHYYIVYNKDFMQKYPDDVQLGILYHELGHIVLGHHDRQFSSIEELQSESDCYALTFVNTTNFREFLKSIGRNYDNGECGF